jgi:hypothetical protein
MDAKTPPHPATHMHSRLLSFISDFERALLADDPSPDEGSWQNERAVNYKTGLARVQLAVLLPDGQRKPRGTVLVQGFTLADGVGCLKAQLSWAGTEKTASHAIFSKPGCNWKSEARKLAANWMAGVPEPVAVVAEVAIEHEEHAAAV